MSGGSIGYAHEHVLTRRHIGELRRVFAVEVRVRSFDGQFSAGAHHRVAGIDSEIEEGAFELGHIRERWPQAAREDDFDINRFSERSAQEFGHI
jgi:hypothetical protein